MFEPLFNTESILPTPPPGELPVLHDREYRVRAYRLGDDRIAVHGAVRDQKPPGLYLANDPEPLTVHHMQLELTIAFPSLEIVDVTTSILTHPATTCPDITERYDLMIGLSIARGFTHKVRELFGGPRGCTHTTALLQAMAPVAMQCFWSMRAAQARLDGIETSMFEADRGDDAERDDTWKLSINTCHVWDEHGQAVADRMAGATWELPVFIRDRVHKLGLVPDASGSADDGSDR